MSIIDLNEGRTLRRIRTFISRIIPTRRSRKENKGRTLRRIRHLYCSDICILCMYVLINRKYFKENKDK